MRVSPEQGLQFSQMLVQDEEPLANINQVRPTTRVLSDEQLYYGSGDWVKLDHISCHLD